MKKYIFAHILCLLLIEAWCRKYDLESEAVKLYGEDFQTVLKRFRKTPDYLMILEDKLYELIQFRYNMATMTMYHYMEKLNKKIGEILGMDSNDHTSTTPPPISSYFRDHFKHRRQLASEKMSAVKKLDSYPQLTSPLTVAERNSFMDLGFEYAGHIIHTTIKSMGPDDEPAKSTRLPYGGDHRHDPKYTTTTEHVHVHEVLPTELPSLPTASPASASTSSFRYRYKPQRP